MLQHLERQSTPQDGSASSQQYQYQSVKVAMVKLKSAIWISSIYFKMMSSRLYLSLNTKTKSLRVGGQIYWYLEQEKQQASIASMHSSFLSKMECPFSLFFTQQDSKQQPQLILIEQRSNSLIESSRVLSLSYKYLLPTSIIFATTFSRALCCLTVNLWCRVSSRPLILLVYSGLTFQNSFEEEPVAVGISVLGRRGWGEVKWDRSRQMLSLFITRYVYDIEIKISNLNHTSPYFNNQHSPHAPKTHSHDTQAHVHRAFILCLPKPPFFSFP